MRGLGVFLSGRLAALGLALMFQIAVARGLPVEDYAAYATAIAGASLTQTVSAFGIPRLASLYLSQAGTGIGRRAAERLAATLVGARAALVCAGVIAIGGGLWMFAPGWVGAHHPLLAAAAAYTLTVSLQSDADAMAQALRLQHPSRAVAILEPTLRVAGLGLLVTGGATAPTAAAVLALSAFTAGLSALALWAACGRRLARIEDAPGARTSLPVKAAFDTALGGQAGTLSWMATSPAVVRLIAARCLPPPVFAAFSFAQALVVSVQRYTPGTMLAPFVEPLAMGDAGRTGRTRRLRAVLGLMVKAETLGVACALAALLIGGGPLVDLMTRGRYPAAARFLPWLIVLVAANAAHRGFEIAALATGAPGVLVRGLGFSVIWLAAMAAGAPFIGVWSVLLCPIGDAVTRLWFVQTRLDRRGLPDLIAPRRLLAFGACGLAIGLGGSALATALKLAPPARVALAAAASLATLLCIAGLRPLGAAEASFLRSFGPPAWRRRPGRGRAPGVVRVAALTPLGLGGKGGVDRLMDGLRPLLSEREDTDAWFLTTRGGSRWLSPLVSALAMSRFVGRLLLGRIDAVHLNLGANASFWRKGAFALVGRAFGAPYVIHLHGSGFDGFWASRGRIAAGAVSALIEGAATVIVLGSPWRDLVAQKAPKAAARLVVLPNATTAIDRAGRSSGPPTLLFLGRLEPRKGVGVLIEALAALPPELSWRAILAGDGEIEATQAALARRGLSARAACAGWLDPDAVRAHLAAADILISPSLEENLPMAVVEGFAAGLAVVATPVGAVSDLIVDGETGLLVPPGESAPLARALERLLRDPELMRRLGAAAKAVHARRLALEPYADALVSIWRQAARRTGGVK